MQPFLLISYIKRNTRMKQKLSSFTSFLLTCIVTFSGAQIHSCFPCNCTQTEGSVIVNCSNKGLSEVPKLCQNNVTHFILSQNKISRIKNNTFVRCSNLISLDLCESEVRLLETGAFEGLTKLKVLNLSSNRLGSDPEQLNNPDVMTPLVNLEELLMNRNKQLGAKRYRTFIFLMRYLPKTKLTTLWLLFITPEFQFCKNDITQDFLESIKTPSLRILYLVWNYIDYFHSIMSAYTPNLEELCLNMNHLTVYNFLFGLKHLRSLQLSYQTVPVITNLSGCSHSDKKAMLGSLKTTIISKLHVCDMEYDTLFKTDSNTIKHSDHIGRISLNNESIWLFYWPTNLTFLTANQIYDLSYLTKNVILYLWNHEKIGDASIDFTGNRIDMFVGTVEICHPSTGLTVDFSFNDCSFISKNAFGKNLASSFVSLDFSYNLLGDLLSNDGGPFPFLNNLKKLYLGYNNIYRISSNVLNGSTHPHLQVLILANNKLLDIPAGVSGLTNLSRLDLSFNRITDLDKQGTIGLINLVHLNVSNNRISYLNSQVLYNFSRLIKKLETKGKMFQLDLSGNPIECSCRSLNFLKWIYRFRRSLMNITNVLCKLQERYMSLSLLKGHILPELERHCLSNQWMYVMAGILISMLTCLTISVIAYRHRWDIKYFCLRLKIRRELYAEFFEERGAFQYDAFVAYSESDSSWIDKHLIPKMEEEETPFRLCVHHRDFEIGWPIEESILRSLSTSRKAIIVVSPHFVRSGWCKFEMHMARVHMMERGVDKIIVILLEDVPIDEMPHTLTAIMRRHTYLVWPGEGMINNVPAFWSRLRLALR